MLYFVSGWPRSGTSVAMAACKAGGMPVLYDVDWDTQWDALRPVRYPLSDFSYEPNPIGGFFSGSYHLPTIEPRELVRLCNNKVAKIFLGALATMQDLPRPAKVLVMRRSSKEILRSWQRMSGLDWFTGPTTPDQLDVQTTRRLLQLQKRPNLSITEIWFADLIADPWTELQKLADAGWPIDVAQAAAVIDPSLYRNKDVSITRG